MLPQDGGPGRGGAGDGGGGAGGSGGVEDLRPASCGPGNSS